MSEQQIIEELISIEAFADELKRKATGLRAKIACVHKRSPKGALDTTQFKRLIAGRRKSIIKNNPNP